MQSLSFDRANSKAILIGISKYSYLQEITPAENNVLDIQAFLTDEKYIGLAPENILTIINKRNDEIMSEVVEFLGENASTKLDTLFLYYVGHGIRDSGTKDLYLTGTNTRSSLLKASAVSFNELKELIENSLVKKRIIIIDACYSGLATMNDNRQIYSDKEISIKGSYTMTSSSGGEKSFFDSFHRNTFFTAAFLQYLKIETQSLDRPAVTLDNIYTYLLKNLKKSTPQRKSNLNVSDFYFAANPFFDPFAAKQQLAGELFTKGDYHGAIKAYKEVYAGNGSESVRLRILECEERLHSSGGNESMPGLDGGIETVKADVANVSDLEQKASELFEKKSYRPALIVYREIFQLRQTEKVMLKIVECERLIQGRNALLRKKIFSKISNIFYNLLSLAIWVAGIYWAYGKCNEKLQKPTFRQVRSEPMELMKNYTEKDSALAHNVKIGSQIWTSKNCGSSYYRNGDLIPYASTAAEWMSYASSKVGCWCYPYGKPKYDAKWGKIYNWYAINDSRGLAPVGWHVATRQEWEDLEAWVSSLYLKSGWKVNVSHQLLTSEDEWGESGYIDDRIIRNSSSDLRLSPSGWRDSFGRFYSSDFENKLAGGVWWAANEYDSLSAWSYKVIRSQASEISQLRKEAGAAVRFIKDKKSNN